MPSKLTDLISTPPADDAAERLARRKHEDDESAERFARLLRLASRADSVSGAGRSPAADPSRQRLPGGRPFFGDLAADGPQEAASGEDLSESEAEVGPAGPVSPGPEVMKSPPRKASRRSAPATSPVQRRESGSPRDGAAVAMSVVVHPAKPADFIDGSARTDREHEAFKQLSRQIQRLCKSGSSGPQSWFVTLRLDPEVIPETELRITASQAWLRLRFSTQSALSVRLISMHMTGLQRELETALDMQQQIDIDFE